MPIKGLSEVRRLPRLGKIRLGIRVKKDSLDRRCKHLPALSCLYCTYPRETKYFVVPEEVAKFYGPEPTEIDVYLPLDETEKVFMQRLNWYTASRLRCAGDGEQALRLFKDAPPEVKKDYGPDTDPAELVSMDCPCPLLESGECKRNGTLNVILPRISLGGVYSISTGSYNSIIEINSDIDFVRALLGRAAMVPLKLKRVEQKIQYQDQPAKAHWILRLEFQGNVDDVNKIKESVRLMPPMFALPPPDRVKPIEIFDDDRSQPESKPKPIVEMIIEEMAGKDQAGRDKVFSEHLEVINKMSNQNKLKVQAAREGKVERLQEDAATQPEPEPEPKPQKVSDACQALMAEVDTARTDEELEAFRKMSVQKINALEVGEQLIVHRRFNQRREDIKQAGQGKLI